MGVALSVCALPGQVTSDRLGPEKMELGLGVVCCFLSYFLLCHRKEIAHIDVSCIFDFFFLAILKFSFSMENLVLL